MIETLHFISSCTYQGWLEHTSNMKQLAENELADTYAIREALFVCREKARNMLISQQERAEHTIRKRIFETQKARNELEWQQLKVGVLKQFSICILRNHNFIPLFYITDERRNGACSL